MVNVEYREANAMWNANGTGNGAESVTEPLTAPRRIRGLRLPAVPSGTLLAQCAGGIAALGGVYGQWGLNVALMVGGVAGAILGMLKEAGKI